MQRIQPTDAWRPKLATAERIKVLVADDEESVRDVLEALLESEPEIDLIGAAADAETAIELACSRLPDVALVDVHMPGGGGPRATREILRRSPPTRVVALSAHEDVSTVMTMLRAGAVGYVVKGDSTDEILSAIHRTVEGKSSVTERLAAPVAPSRPVNPASSIVCRTTFRRATARSMLTVGAYDDGDFTSPARSAASGTVSSKACLAK